MNNTYQSDFKGKKNGQNGKRKDENSTVVSVNIEAERILLASALVDNQVYEATADKVRPEDFSDPLHVQVWKAIGSLVGRGKRAEPASIIPQINERAPLADMTVEAYLVGLRYNARDKQDIGAFVDAIVSASQGRSIHKLCEDFGRRATSGPSGLLVELSGAVVKLAGGDRSETYAAIKGEAEQRFEAIRAKHRMAPGTINGLSTGFPRLDRIIDGLRPATLTVIGARPKNGKTALCASMIQLMSQKDVPVAFFSLEMPRDQIVDRFIAMVAEVDYTAMTRGILTAEELDRVQVAAAEVNGWPLIIDDAGGLSPSALGIKARNAVKVDGCKAVFIDYLQRLRPEKGGGKRYEEVTEISMAIADLRKTLNIPIVAMAQLNRKLSDRTEKTDFDRFGPEQTRPTDSDLRDSGQIEQDADTLIFINRPITVLEKLEPVEKENQSADSPHSKWEAACNRWRKKAEISVHFNRSGPTGFVDFLFHAPQMRFEEVGAPNNGSVNQREQRNYFGAGNGRNIPC